MFRDSFLITSLTVIYFYKERKQIKKNYYSENNYYLSDGRLLSILFFKEVCILCLTINDIYYIVMHILQIINYCQTCNFHMYIAKATNELF